MKGIRDDTHAERIADLRGIAKLGEWPTYDFSASLYDAANRIAELEAERDALRDAIKFAHERLEPESDCPLWEHMAESLRQLADERAGWMEVAVEHNVQCEQLNGTKVRYKTISRGVDILRAAREAEEDAVMISEKKIYVFTLAIRGEGWTQEQALENAVECFQTLRVAGQHDDAIPMGGAISQPSP